MGELARAGREADVGNGDPALPAPPAATKLR
jgi:hypothetical protein